jgi:signal transduction histidine kinase
MGERIRELVPWLGGPFCDLAFGVAVVAFALVALVAAGDFGTADSVWLVVVLAAICGCAALARRLPLTFALLACLPVFGAGDLGTSSVLNTAQDGLLVAVFLLIYRVATRAAVRPAVAVTVLVSACWQAGAIWQGGRDAVNPAFLYLTCGACAVGLIVRARGQARAELAARGRELAVAQARYAAESVRYERTRIARELHDIVAHCVSAMVVQAGAGQKLAARDPELAAEAFDHISASAQQAEEEIERLVLLLEGRQERQFRSIEELVQRASTTGLAISYRLVGGVDQLDAEVSDAAYAVVQEALTNALKHAPGALIQVCVQSTPAALGVVVTNGPARAAGLGLAASGGGHGLGGMRERVMACGGTLQAGPAADGGWRIAANLPPASTAPGSASA